MAHSIGIIRGELGKEILCRDVSRVKGNPPHGSALDPRVGSGGELTHSEPGWQTVVPGPHLAHELRMKIKFY